MVDELHILVVDDKPELRLLLTLVLEDTPGWTVVGEAADGREALAVAERARPDLVVLDASMPVMDGVTALPDLRALLPEAVIVLLTAFPRDYLWDRAFAAGADECLEKTDIEPWLCDRLAEVVRRTRERRGIPGTDVTIP